MKNKSLFIKITILLSTLLVGIFTGQQAFADDRTIDIVIHKQLWDQAPDAKLFKIRERPIKISKIQSKGSALRFMTLQRIIINWSKALTKQQLFK
jgi:hypothetical protein